MSAIIASLCPQDLRNENHCPCSCPPAESVKGRDRQSRFSEEMGRPFGLFRDGSSNSAVWTPAIEINERDGKLGRTVRRILSRLRNHAAGYLSLGP